MNSKGRTMVCLSIDRQECGFNAAEKAGAFYFKKRNEMRSFLKNSGISEYLIITEDFSLYQNYTLDVKDIRYTILANWNFVFTKSSDASKMAKVFKKDKDLSFCDIQQPNAVFSSYKKKLHREVKLRLSHNTDIKIKKLDELTKTDNEFYNASVVTARKSKIKNLLDSYSNWADRIATGQNNYHLTASINFDVKNLKDGMAFFKFMHKQLPEFDATLSYFQCLLTD